MRIILGIWTVWKTGKSVAILSRARKRTTSTPLSTGLSNIASLNAKWNRREKGRADIEI